ncbi:MAG TPA: hypothetical protein V6C86_07235 [Oculatellaceae cyanobacterium]
MQRKNRIRKSNVGALGSSLLWSTLTPLLLAQFTGSVLAQNQSITPKRADSLVEAIGIQPVLPTGDNAQDHFARNVAYVNSLGIRHAVYSIPPLIPDVRSHITSRQILYMAQHGIKSVVLSKLKVDGKGEYHHDEPTPPVYPSKYTSPPADVVKVVKALGPGAVVEGVVGPNEYLVGSHNDDPQAPAKLKSYMVALQSALANDPATRKVPIIGPTLDPSPYVINPATGRPKGSKWSEIWDTSVQLDLSNFVNYGNVHIYDLPFDESKKGQQDRNAWESRLYAYELAGYPRLGTDRFFMTETGFCTTPNLNAFRRAVSPTEQARYLPRQLLRYFKAGFKSIYIYQLQDRGTDRNDPEQCYGIISADGTPKPAYFAVKRLLNMLAEPSGGLFQPKSLKLSIETKSKTVDYMLFQKKSGEYILALWNMVDSADALNTPEEQVLVHLAKPARDARLYDVVQSDQPQPLRQVNSDFAVPLGKDVLLLQFRSD